ncbi:MAG: hypothetical protein PF692_13445 [Kiritimatiellae bacterium]|nr:hypothetical protein [Kiritimatiellia bacterium]
MRWVWGINDAKISQPVLKALEENRMLILEMQNKDGNLLAAKQHNEFVIANSNKPWVPHIAKGGMLEQLLKDVEYFNL